MTSMTVALSRCTVFTATWLFPLYWSTAMKSLTSLLTVSLMLATGAVLADEPKAPQATPAAAPQAMDHSKMDMSHMTPADHEKMAMAKFAKLDTNNDGMLSKAEFAKLHAMMGMQHGSMDQGKMDHSMMDKQHGKMDHSKMDHGKMGMSGMKSPDHQKMAAEEFAKLDTNKDGKLSKTEIPATHPMSAHFDMLDGNKDGSVSKDEFTKHHGM
ncbi:MAG: EF-hand domain-containing protein [Luteimonas sp.]